MSRSDHLHTDALCECTGSRAERERCVNCCVPDFMSRCGAGPRLSEQLKCRFFQRSSFSDRCMHYCVSLEGHCDCVDAQRERKAAPASARRG